ncbi:MAG: hydrogenase 4 subunit B [Nitrospirae bacterium]|nr:MAG: hydrogenase 4 subunit B [Nitrospirota bacterium]
MIQLTLTPLNLASFAIILLLAQTAIASILRKNERLMVPVCFALSSAASFAATAAGVWTVGLGSSSSAVMALGLPGLPFHLRLDPLSGYFLGLIGLLSFFVSIYSIGYVKGFIGHRPIARLCIFYGLFIAGMFMVVLADDALFFLISWETMAAASYFLVMFEDERVENRRAAFLYIVVAHVGAVAILLAFGVMAGLATGFDNFSGFTFDAMRQADFPPEWATVAFLLAFFGFGAKAGIVPMHVWLPEAHPVAPSNVSALMSGVMLKTAVYGILRVTFDLIKIIPWWWGALVLALGIISALMGILYAMMEKDLKRLLAYSSVENIGIIMIGVGMAMVFKSFGQGIFAALALIAALYHAVNHAMFKGLLFMGAGAVLHATHERNMEEMGGLIHKMPWTAALFLIGCVSISALPPFNGFVSEWLTFQAFLLSPALPSPLMKLLMPLGAALLALTAALAAACFVKAFGVTFLGNWRGRHRTQVQETCWPIRIAMGMAATSCLLLGILPTVFIDWMDVIAEQLTGGKLATSAGAVGWMWLTPIAPERASYSGLVVFSGILAVYAIVYIILHVNPGKIRRGHVWDCGFEKLTNRMQYNAISFSMPIRRIFGFLFNIKEEVRLVPQQAHSAFPQKLIYSLRIRDRFWNWIYKPVADASFWLSRRVGRLQQGRINTYLIYSFVTIILLLLFVR